MKHSNFVFAALMLIAFAVPARAQRLIPGQWQLTFGGEVGVISSIPAGGEVSFNKINYSSKMICKLAATTERRDYVSAQCENPLDSRNIDIYASWGYLWNLCHNRSRSVNLWGGVTVDAGARVRNCLDDCTGNSSLIPAVGFLYGFSPELNFEFFPTTNFSMSLFARPHLQFYTRGNDYSGDGAEYCFYPLIGLQFNFYMFVGK